MTTRTLKLLVASIIGLLSLPSQSDAAGLADLTYDASGPTVTITGCDASATGPLTIPDTIEGKPVTTIGPSAFFNCHGITTLALGNGVREIRPLAFFGLRGLEEVRFGPNVTTVGNRAFNAASALETVVFNDGLATIGSSAFERCSELEFIEFPATVRSLGESAFRHCSKLLEIVFAGDAPNFGENVFASIRSRARVIVTVEAEGFVEAALEVPLLIRAGSVTYAIHESTASVVDCEPDASGHITIPEELKGKTITEFENSAFQNCTQITGITIPPSVRTLGTRVFGGCSSLVSISLPDSIRVLPSETFFGCSSLRSIQLSDLVTTIESSAFRSCTALTEFFLPENVNRIRNNAFTDCTSLQRVVMLGRLSFLEASVFSNCTNLEEVFIGQRMRSIDSAAFEGCINLKRLVFERHAPSVRGNTLTELNSELVAIAIPEARGFRNDFGGITVLRQELPPFPEPNTPLPPTQPAPPTPPLPGGALETRITGIQVTTDGQFQLLLSGAADNLSVLYTGDLSTTFTPLSSGVTAAENAFTINPENAGIGSDQGFFRLGQE